MWWIQLKDDGGYKEPAQPVHRRDLQPNLDLSYEDQTLAVYPETCALPWPYPFPMDREAGINAYGQMITAGEAMRPARGETEGLVMSAQISMTPGYRRASQRSTK